jgi:NADPH-dependent 2,4-dienoyl-CoA reductase/sulfur reductase-like enzyme/nitrite reductase/ring-hydroxylating ferredoxin subunit
MSTDRVLVKVDELKEGEMKEVEINEDLTLLVVRLDGEFRAFAGKCPHHGASLAEGILHEKHIRCPWHHAVFDGQTGRVKEVPSMDSLSRFDVHVKGDEVVVTLPDAPQKACTPEMARPDPEQDGRTFVIVGTGAAGITAAETLRQEGFRGRILMLTREPHLPYDRTDLSKPYLRKPDARKPFLRSRAFYEKNGIEILTGHEVTGLNPEAKSLACGNGKDLSYDQLLLATGAAPRPLGVPGEDLKNVVFLRTLDDCEQLRGLAERHARAVVVGASFIAMEVCAALIERGLSVTVVAPESVPFEGTLGPEIGQMYQKAHEEKGVIFQLGNKVDRFEGDGLLRRVLLQGGEGLEADLAVLGVGVEPVTDYLEGTNISRKRGVLVDGRQCLTEGVYAAGDIARFPDWRTQEPIRIEHWRVAQEQGQVAARNMVGRTTVIRSAPFFWTNQYFVITSYVGFAGGWEEIVFEGSPAEQRFVGLYVQQGRVLAASGCAEERRMCLMSEILRAPEAPKLDDVRNRLASGT